MHSVRQVAQRMRAAYVAYGCKLLDEPFDRKRADVPVRGILFSRYRDGTGYAFGTTFVSHSNVEGQTFMVL